MKMFYNENGNCLKNEFQQMGKNSRIKIATAFFSNSDIIKEFLNNNCKINMIIRLNKGTSPNELEKILNFNSENIEIKFFTSEKFHPKFYIFDDSAAYIGSSNLTSNGLAVNQEMNIKIEEPETIKQLSEIFDSYWKQAEKLSLDSVKKFKEIIERNKKDEAKKCSEEICKEIGDIKYRDCILENVDNINFKFYCTGEDENHTRDFKDYVKYGFISAGQKNEKGYLYSKEIQRFRKNDYFFAYRKQYDGKKQGYVGVGKILEEAKPINDFRIDGKKIKELKLCEPNILKNKDNDACEWLCKVKWIKTIKEEEAPYFKKDIFYNRNTVCKIDKTKLQGKETVDFLIEKFGLKK